MNISVIGTGGNWRYDCQKTCPSGASGENCQFQRKRKFDRICPKHWGRGFRFGKYCKKYRSFNPFRAIAVKSLPKTIFETLPTSAIVVDTGNYYPKFRDENIAEIDNRMPESVWVSEQIGRKVIKAFNTLLAFSLQNLGKKKSAENRLAMQVSGDDEHQKDGVVISNVHLDVK